MAGRYRAPRGTYDLVFPESEKVDSVVRLACDVMSRFGYRRIETPVIEDTDVFTRTIGEDTDIVRKEMYTFEDRSGESLTLRPEGTAGVMRAFLERGLASRGLPQKLFYSGPMFRRERPQAGRYRQFYQVGAEVIGSDDPFADAEIVAISSRLFGELGLKRYRLLLNSVGCARCRPDYVASLSSFLGRLADVLCEECARRSEHNPLRVFDCKNESCRRALDGAPTTGSMLCPRCREHFDSVARHLDGMDVGFEVDDRLVRGLDYYTNTAFEYQFEGLGAQNTVSGGGRYDYLAEELGGPPTPGVGFSLGIERLMLAIEAQELEPFGQRGLDVFIIVVPGVDRRRALAVLDEARKAGLSADVDMMERGMKAQMKQADRLRARLAVIIGPDELEKGEVAVRDLEASDQWSSPLEGLIESVRNRLGDRPDVAGGRERPVIT